MRLLFWHKKTEKTAPYILLKIPGSLVDFFAKVLVNGCIWKYPTK